jgi:hypothetical protein
MISSISAVGLSQDVFSSGYSTQQQALQALQNNLSSGNLTGARSAFQSLQSVLQNSATATGSTTSSNSQLTTDLTSLGSALSSGNLSTAQSAFATVLGDLKNSASPAQINEASAASQSVQLIADLLSSLNSSSSSSSTLSSTLDLTSPLLQSVYGSQGGLNVYA